MTQCLAAPCPHGHIFIFVVREQLVISIRVGMLESCFDAAARMISLRMSMDDFAIAGSRGGGCKIPSGVRGDGSGTREVTVHSPLPLGQCLLRHASSRFEAIDNGTVLLRRGTGDAFVLVHPIVDHIARLPAFLALLRPLRVSGGESEYLVESSIFLEARN